MLRLFLDLFAAPVLDETLCLRIWPYANSLWLCTGETHNHGNRL